MKKLALTAALALSLAGQIAVASTGSLNNNTTGITTAQLEQRQAIHWVSVEQIRESLKGQAPMAVGFDVDDTVLFSSPGFVLGKRTYSPDSNDYLNNDEFWQKMNSGWDDFSIPKESARALINMHTQRGDRIYFVTGRPASKNETVTKTLQEMFHLKDIQPVIFAGDLNKINQLKSKNIKVYYGDSDQDITSANAIHARPIRVLRASNSSNQPLPKNGNLGEEVLVNSAY
ncbi:Class B acid phosphatase [invertebrate metagenome]|uniref:Class B acid phosphatase n=1 Tax=invertebrate metagenome TaxID=1711999 RepID=A0A2H9T954_9ZZZZ